MLASLPPIQPFAQGTLAVEGGHTLAWSWSGAPEGRPAVVLHGGPGAGGMRGARRWFDLAVWRVLSVDQRGAGESTPGGEDGDLSTQTTQHLIADLEALRVAHGVERWAVVGVSWGTTLGLAYAQAHPERVSGLVLGLVTTTSAEEVAWITEGVGCLFPEAWERFAAAVPPSLRGERLVDAYAILLSDPNPGVRAAAAAAWCDWEDTHVSLSPGHTPSLSTQSPTFQLRFSRLVTHYWRHAAFLAPGQLLDGAARLAGIPGALVHGRYDVSSPLRTAWQLSKRWPGSVLEVLEGTGHGDAVAFPAAMTAQIRRLTCG